MKKAGKTVENFDCLRSVCPVSSVLDILGDKWTLLVVRDMLLLNKRQYGELLDSPEKIPTNILAERLKRLQLAGIVEKHPYQDKPVRYEYLLTDKGKALRPVIIEMVQWGSTYIPGTAKPPKGFLDQH